MLFQRLGVFEGIVWNIRRLEWGKGEGEKES